MVLLISGEVVQVDCREAVVPILVLGRLVGNAALNLARVRFEGRRVVFEPVVGKDGSSLQVFGEGFPSREIAIDPRGVGEVCGGINRRAAVFGAVIAGSLVFAQRPFAVVVDVAHLYWHGAVWELHLY